MKTWTYEDSSYLMGSVMFFDMHFFPVCKHLLQYNYTRYCNIILHEFQMFHLIMSLIANPISVTNLLTATYQLSYTDLVLNVQ